MPQHLLNRRDGDSLMHQQGRTGVPGRVIRKVLLHSGQLPDLGQQLVGFAVTWDGCQLLDGWIAVDDLEGLPVEEQGQRELDFDVSLCILMHSHLVRLIGTTFLVDSAQKSE